MNCPFCHIDNTDVVIRSNLFLVIFDRYPVTKGHTLIISKRHAQDYFELNPDERKELTSLVDKVKELLETDYDPSGYNIGMNCGESAGQTIFHFHCHVIPRYYGDMKDPRGGVRHSVEGKGYY